MKHVTFWLAMLISLAFLALSGTPYVAQAMAGLTITAWLLWLATLAYEWAVTR